MLLQGIDPMSFGNVAKRLRTSSNPFEKAAPARFEEGDLRKVEAAVRDAVGLGASGSLDPMAEFKNA